MQSAQRTAEQANTTQIEWCESSSCVSREDNPGAGAHLAASGSRLCPGCKDLLRSDLTRLPALHAACGHTLTGRAQHPVERVTGSWKSGIALNADAVDARSAISRALARWSAYVVSEGAAQRPERRDIAALSGFLVGHVDWLAGRAAAGRLADEMRALVREADRAARLDPQPRRIELGPCAHVGCESVVISTIPAGGAHAEIEVNCDSGHSWHPHQWLLLARREAFGTAPSSPRCDVSRGEPV